MIDATIAERSPAAAVHSRLLYAVAAWLGFGGLAMSAVAMLVLNLVASGQVSPLSSTMSNYVFVDGYGWLFPAAVLGMAAGGFAVLLALARSILGAGTLLRCTVALASACCALVAMFPTNRTGPLTLSAEIHRYAAGVAFCCVPIAAFLVAARLNAVLPRSTAAVWLHRSALVSTLILAVFLTSHLGLVPEPMQHLRGMFQRTQFLVQLLTLAQLLLLLTRPTPRACLPTTSSCPRSLYACWRPATQTHEHERPTREHERPTRVQGTRTRVVDVLPATLGWHTVGVWMLMPRSGMRSPNASPPSR